MVSEHGGVVMVRGPTLKFTDLLWTCMGEALSLVQICFPSLLALVHHHSLTHGVSF